MNQIMPLTAGADTEIQLARAFLQQQVRLLFPQLPHLDKRPDLLGLAEAYVQPPRCAFYAAFAQGEVVGTAALCPYDDRLPDVRGVYDLPVTAEVCRVYVREDQRGRGLGQAMMQRLTASAHERGFSTLCLHTHRHLSGGFAFWERQGFSVRLERPPTAEDMGVVYMDRGIRGQLQNHLE